MSLLDVFEPEAHSDQAPVLLTCPACGEAFLLAGDLAAWAGAVPIACSEACVVVLWAEAE